MSFERDMARLDEIVALLSDSATTLERSLELYTEGAELIGRCDKRLSEARLTIETLLPRKEENE